MSSFRFGVLLAALESAHASTFSTPDEFKKKVKRLESYGFDVLSVPDHLGSVAPFPALAAAAGATSTMRLGTAVINVSFYNPTLLLRDVAEVDKLSDGRLELGLGAGYVPEELAITAFATAGARARIDHLDGVATLVRSQLPNVPIMIAGNGNRLLTMAVQRADIVGLSGEPGKPGVSDSLADRIAVIRNAAGPRFESLEVNLLLAGLPTDTSGRADLSLARRKLPDLPDEELARLPGVLHGTPKEIADTLRSHAERHNISYLTVMEFHADYFVKVIEELR